MVSAGTQHSNLGCDCHQPVFPKWDHVPIPGLKSSRSTSWVTWVACSGSNACSLLCRVGDSFGHLPWTEDGWGQGKDIVGDSWPRSLIAGTWADLLSETCLNLSLTFPQAFCLHLVSTSGVKDLDEFNGE